MAKSQVALEASLLAILTTLFCATLKRPLHLKLEKRPSSLSRYGTAYVSHPLQNQEPILIRRFILRYVLKL